MRQAKFYISVTVVAIVALSVARVVMTNNISTNGIDLGKIQEQIAEYKKENSLLHEQILRASSLNTIANEATHGGFVPSKDEMVLKSPLPLALKQ